MIVQYCSSVEEKICNHKRRKGSKSGRYLDVIDVLYSDTRTDSQIQTGRQSDTDKQTVMFTEIL